VTEAEGVDRAVRKTISAAIRRRGRVPTIAEVAGEMGMPVDQVRASFDRMIASHVFIPRRDSSEIFAYNPFCAERTEFRVRADGREWWAICGWDALGIPAALGVAGTIEASCADCGDRLVIDVDRDGTATSATPAALHVGVPARDFWKDIYVT